MSGIARAVLAAEGVTQRFGAVEVLSDVSLALVPGEVHAVIGENGAGKSTLMKILSGHLVPTGGRVLVDGEPLGSGGVASAERRGVVLVHQEILLAPDLTAAENIFLGREPRRGLVVDRRRMNREAGEALRDLGAQIAPDTPVHRLSIAQRQLVQIARALLVPHRAVIFDEPTASLTPHETEALIAVIRRISQRGVGVLYISHRLPEVKLIATRVTVLRDGRRVDTLPTEALDTAGMARLMVGRDVARLYPERAGAAASAAETVLQAEDIHVPGFVHGASFKLKRGEILGFAGLVGAGRTELMEGILALRPAVGRVRLEGRETRFRRPADAMRAGIVYLSEDRKGKGLLLAQDLRTNLTLAALDGFAGALGINRRREDAALGTAIREFDIRTRDPRLLAGQLSGGNQQKLLLAKMMLLNPRIVVIDEPTRGIDIGTKAEIYRFVAELAEAGKSVIVVSSEMPELIGLCDRILVMREGRVAGEVAGAGMTERAIVMLATGTSEKEAALVAEDA